MPRHLLPLAWAVLLVALVLGVGTMHTLGHPAEHGAPDHGAAAAELSHSAPVSPAPAAAELPALDPSTMCLAIIAVATLLLGLGSLTRAPSLELRLPRWSRVQVSWWAPTPPRPPSLAQLQALRI
ncbi:hypothetical protein J4H86_06895 [Spiractinospora alimapuensis]|nr:hypothetical protein J4H86_06895 [Spiractinospora alimapuensis]